MLIPKQKEAKPAYVAPSANDVEYDDIEEEEEIREAVVAPAAADAPAPQPRRNKPAQPKPQEPQPQEQSGGITQQEVVDMLKGHLERAKALLEILSD